MNDGTGAQTRILVVEDDFTARRLITELLAGNGRVDVAVSGEEAVAAFGSALNRGDPYDLVFLDIELPGINGDEALARIRELEEREDRWPGLKAARIVMTTSRSDSRTIVGAFKAQCDMYLVKPVVHEKLAAAMQKLEIPFA